MSEEHTTTAVERYLHQLAEDLPAEPIVRALLDQAVNRLHWLCASLLFRSYPRLAHPPLNLRADELLSAVVERLLKALREARPPTVRQFLGLADQPMRWELNDLARRLDEQPAVVELHEGLVPVPAGSGSWLTPNSRRMLQAIENLPEDEREVIWYGAGAGYNAERGHPGAGRLCPRVRRRLNRGLRLLVDLRPQKDQG
jgi:DNA-directed RNA polymerase specialized sigma24 family protein